jgi:hypothetical protein
VREDRHASRSEKNERPDPWLHFVTGSDRAAAASQSVTPGNRSPKESSNPMTNPVAPQFGLGLIQATGRRL